MPYFTSAMPISLKISTSHIPNVRDRCLKMSRKEMLPEKRNAEKKRKRNHNHIFLKNYSVTVSK